MMGSASASRCQGFTVAQPPNSMTRARAPAARSNGRLIARSLKALNVEAVPLRSLFLCVFAHFSLHVAQRRKDAKSAKKEKSNRDEFIIHSRLKAVRSPCG